MNYHWKNQNMLLDAKDTPYNDLVNYYIDAMHTEFNYSLDDLHAVFSEGDGESSASKAANDYKFGTYNTVSGTATAFINGVKLDTIPSTAQQWEEAFATLVAQQPA
jgi:hypothetical protein